MRVPRLAFLAPLAAIVLAVPLLAQTVAPGVVRLPPSAATTRQQQGAPTFDPANSPETARAAIQQLRQRNLELRRQLGVSVADLQRLRQMLDAATTPGGSRVTASCASPTLSRNSAGAQEDCSASGYACAAVSGLCHRSCNTTDMCAPGFVCDTGAHTCVWPVSD